MKKVWLSWSSGKDSAWALHTLHRQARIQVMGLLTTINSEHQRVAMHGVRRRLLEEQAESAGLPLKVVELPSPCSNEAYEKSLTPVWQEAAAEGIDGIAFGDLFLEDVRRYRVEQLEGTALEPLFPLWGLDTTQLAARMVASGLKAAVTCVDPAQLDPSFAGREFGAEMLDDLPDDVDPCGERGEFHTVVYDGPMFEHPLALLPGVIVQRDGFVFADFR